MININDYFNNMPLLHSWDNGVTWNTGGFKKEHLAIFLSEIQKIYGTKNVSIIETGAGNSTVTFLFLKPKKLLTIAPDEALRDRIHKYCDENGIDRNALDYRIEFSESELPKIASIDMPDEDMFDVALMDGGHGWPTVFVDFCYMNMALRKGGLLIVDDVQIHAVKELVRMLYEQPQYKFLGQYNKIMLWQKITDDRLLGGHGTQPYIKRRTLMYRETEGKHLLYPRDAVYDAPESPSE